MREEYIIFDQNQEVYYEYNNGRVYKLKNDCLDQVNELERVEDAFNFSQSEIDWMNTILKESQDC